MSRLLGAGLVLRRLVTVGVLALVGGACSDGSSTGTASDEPPAPVAAVDLHAQAGPGTPLLEDFEVAEGSSLIGYPVPIGSNAAAWSAYLFLDGDPAEVVETYLEQAAEQGFELLVPPNDGEGYEEGPIPADRNRIGRCGLQLSQDSSISPIYRCEAAAEDAQGRCFEVTAIRDDFRSHAYLNVFRPASAAWSCYPLSIAGDLDEPPPAMPTRYPARPQTGEALGTRFGGLRDLSVQPGSRVVAAPASPVDAIFCGSTVVLEVIDEPVEVLDAYAAAAQAMVPSFDVPANSDPTVAAGTSGELTTQIRAFSVPAGGDSYVFQLVSSTDGPAYIYAYSCSD